MSYKALLFCPDEAAARLVTQVLSELDFAVELSFEPFATVKKLTEEPYDALVVDCNDEQNASLLFKGARSSDLNHSSLCVAVAEGQAGVAKAFKIGANLVLTKPINAEQSKNTLRVARGLLRKNAPAPRTGVAGGPSQTQGSSSPATTFPPPASQGGTAAPNNAAPALSSSQPVLAGRTAGMPSSLLEAEQAKPPAAAPAIAMKPAPTPSFDNSGASTLGRASTSSGAAAAPALAREKSNTILTSATEAKAAPELRTAAPLATHDAIFAETTFRPEPELNIPSILSHARSAPEPGRGKAFLIVGCLFVLAGAGYFGWRKFEPMRYVHFGTQSSGTASSAPAPAQSESQGAKPSPDVNAPAEQQAGASSSAGAPNNAGVTVSPSTSAAPEGFPTKERIDIGAPVETAEPEVTVAAKPLQVSKKPARSAAMQSPPAVAPAPPSLILQSANAPDSALAGIVTTNVVLPKPTPGTLRISQGITQGLLVKRVPPSYPLAALQMRREGGVELLATISKSGAITRVQVLSGDAILAKSAVEAVRQWKYRPYLLNGEPVEIETQITVNFKMPH